MTADADIQVFNPHNNQIASSGVSTPTPDSLYFITNSEGNYTIKVYGQPTKYKLEVYVR
jgi:hypothetical protein